MKYAVLSVMLSAAAFAGVGEYEGDLSQDQSTLQAMAGVSWDSQYIWRGFDVFNDKSAMHVLADVGLGDTGLGASVVGHQSVSEPFGSLQRWDGTVYYQNLLFAGEAYATNFRVGFVYYYYPKANLGHTQDLMEGHAILSWPNLVPVPGLQPSYAFAYMLPGRNNSWAEIRRPGFDDNTQGMFHIFMLDYAFTTPALLASMDDQVIKLHSELVYNGGVSPFGQRVESGFSNAVVGASTDFAFGVDRNIVVTPAVYYQLSLEDTVNPTNEFWAGVSLKYLF